jgi:8-oxo-dGTP pyrophosphatase MutT (NUDIX family)
MDILIKRIIQALEGDLPGMEAHAAMAPRGLGDERFRLKVPSDALLGSVLILLYEIDGEAFFPLMQRPVYDGHHSGQISLPGGKLEPGDPDRVATALREAEEEMGIPRQRVEVLGNLSELYIPPSNFRVLPVLGYMREKPLFIPDPVEVASIIETPVRALLTPEARQETDRPPGIRYSMRVPYFAVGEHVVWGATAMMLSEFLSVVQPLLEDRDIGTAKR